jgi:hypothetical protein
LGINQGTPLYSLDVTGTGRFTGNTIIGTRTTGNIRNLNIYGGTNNNAILKLDGADGNGYGAQVEFISKNSGGTSNQWTLGTAITTNSNTFELYNGTGVVMAATIAGNVGIGTTSPTVIGANYRTLEVTSPTGGGYVIVSDNSGVKGEIAADGAVYVSSKSAHPLIFRTTDTERMRITSGGDVVINSTSAASSCKLNVYYSDATNNGLIIRETSNAGSANYVLFNSAGTQTGSISRVGTTSAVLYNTSSDYRLKEDLKEIKGLAIISKIKVYDFKWIGTNERMDGVLAHELQEILPYAVSGKKDELEKDGTIKSQGVDYSKIVPILVKSIQELQEQITELKQIVATK